jgi:hypothetical protein
MEKRGQKYCAHEEKMSHSMPLFQAAGLFNPKRFSNLCSKEDFLVKDFVECLKTIKNLKGIGPEIDLAAEHVKYQRLVGERLKVLEEDP